MRNSQPLIGKLRANAMIFLALSLLISTGSFVAPAQAQKAAVAKTYKIGYFNLAMVKLSCPESAGTEALRAQAEAQLKRDVEEANRKVEKFKQEKKSPEEIQKLVSTIQTEVNAKQQALAQLLQTATGQANEKIVRAVNTVAREQGLDLVVDGAGVFTGGQQVLENGVDITSETIKKLQPGAQMQTSSAEPKAAAPAPAKKAE
jgi:Skp family chaperone for outer membrane proteins